MNFTLVLNLRRATITISAKFITLGSFHQIIQAEEQFQRIEALLEWMLDVDVSNGEVDFSDRSWDHLGICMNV